MLESIPTALETTIYLYFVCVASIGLYLHSQLWLSTRPHGTGQ